MATDHASRLRELEHQDQLRKHMIRLCVYKALALNGPIPNATNSNGPAPKSLPEKADSADLATLRNKLQDYERRISVMKSQLSIKDQAHDAKVEELKSVVDRLQSQLETTKCLDLGASKPKQRLPPRKRPLSSPGLFHSSANSSFTGFSSSQTRPSLLSADAANDRKGKGNSFADSDSLFSQPSLKLSRAPSTSGKSAASSRNSSAEPSPVKRKNSGLLSDKELSDVEANSTAKFLGASDGEDAFLSANSTFEKEKKSRKIRLFSTEASKRILQQQEVPFDTETADPNSLNYYQDENFDEDEVSPAKPVKRPLEQAEAPPAKKRHVFKI